MTFSSLSQNVAPLPAIPGAKPRNIIFILTDDHRYDAMGFMNHPFLKTPGMDQLAREGVHFKNAFVTTALCSPSRASILTGLYTHRHGVVDNNNPVRQDLVFFPQHLQRAGYETAFFGKWHMGGESDAPQRGFNHWVGFKGQGTYQPSPNGLNINGKRVPQKGYITDEMTDYAVEWLKGRSKDKPYFMYVSHKAVHSEFIPAERHQGRYKNAPFTLPPLQDDGFTPMWVKNQRNSWHGIDFPYHSRLNVGEYYKRYCETLLAVDESIQRLMKELEQRGELQSTLIVYMGDNGFLFGEHGLIDKRVAYEESMRVPMLMRCPELFKGGTEVKEIVANIDIAATLLEAGGLTPPATLDGKSVLKLARGERIPWRENFLYEYYWERNFPQTPTVHALRTPKYKFIRVQGLWDLDELYDLESDPKEQKNLIKRPELQTKARELNAELFKILKQTDGLQIPLLPDRGGQQNLRSSEGSKPAEFPPALVQ